MSTPTNQPAGKNRLSPRFQVLLLIAVQIVIALGIAWALGAFETTARPPSNSIMVISPYRYNGTWVFDDRRTGLVREPFVAGVPEMIDILVADIPDAADGFRLTFSAQEFPDYEQKLHWLRHDGSGNTYQLEGTNMEGWLCPALLKYYADPPREIYVKADPTGA